MDLNLEQLSNIKTSMTPMEKILVGNYYYKYSPDDLFLSDGEYTAELSKLSKYHPLRYLRWEQVDNYIDFIERVLDKYNIPHLDIIQSTDEDYNEAVDLSDKANYKKLFPSPRSIQMIEEEMQIVNQYIPQLVQVTMGLGLENVELFISYKDDGWKIKNYFDSTGNKVVYSHTRGRYTDNTSECTDLMKMKLPELISTEDKIYSVEGELMITKQGLQYLKQHYPDKTWNNVRNSVTSVVNQTVDLVDGCEASLYHAYWIDCYDKNTGRVEPVFERTSDMYDWLESVGFTVPTRRLITVPVGNKDYWELVEETSNQFIKAFDEMSDYYTNYLSTVIECDGLVLQPNYNVINNQLQQLIQGSFNDGLVALKAGIWYKKTYTSVVEEIIYSKAAKRKNLNLKIRPVRSELGQIMRNVDVGRLYIGSKEYEDIRIGDTIEFSNHSQQNIRFIRNLSNIERKEKLKQKDIK